MMNTDIEEDIRYRLIKASDMKRRVDASMEIYGLVPPHLDEAKFGLRRQDIAADHA